MTSKIESILAYEQPEWYLLTEKYHNPHVLETLCSVDPTASGYNDIDDALWHSNIPVLKRMLKYVKKKTGSNTLKYMKSDYNKGRYWVSPSSSTCKNTYGLQNIYNKVRRLLMNGEYHDVDLANCQPVLMLQIGEWFGVSCDYIKRYVDSRDTHLKEICDAFSVPRDVAKNYYIVTMFGGDVTTWAIKNKIVDTSKVTPHMMQFAANIDTLRKKLLHEAFFKEYVMIQKNLKKKSGNRAVYGAMGLFLQDVESKVLTVMYRHLESKGFKVATLIHDGLLVNKSDKMCPEILRECEASITENLGLSMRLEEKPTKPTDADWAWFNAHKPFAKKVKDSSEDGQSDQIAARNALVHYDGKVARTDRGLLLYDSLTGVWSSSEDDHLRIMERDSSHWISIVSEGDTTKTFHSHFTPMYKLFRVKAPFVANWDHHERDIGFLCFANGVLDMNRYEMLPFDPKYRFSVAINREFDTDSDLAFRKDELMDRLFNKQFTDLEKRDYTLEKLARGFAGLSSFVDRQFQYYIGDTSCGKGQIRTLCMTAFEGYVQSFNANNLLLTSGNSGDDEKDNKWIIDFCSARMAISNEICMKTETTQGKYGSKKSIVGINAEILKMLVSGGDVIKARKLHCNAGSVVNKANICIFVNDVPTVKPVSDAYLKRANYITFDRSSDPTITTDNETHFVADDSISALMADPVSGDAFVEMMCEYYQKSVEKMMPRPESVVHQSRELSGAGEEGGEWILANYELYRDVGEIKDLVKSTDGMIDWEEADGWFIQFDTLYEFYMKAGNVESKNKFGAKLKALQLMSAVRKINGKPKRVIVGIRPPPKQSVSLSFIKDDDF